MAEELEELSLTASTKLMSPEDFKFIRFKREGEVVRLTMARPEHNLLHEAMLREMAASFEHVATLNEVKLVVLDSAYRVFSGGIDLGEYTRLRVFQVLDAFEAAFLAMLSTSKPLLVVVNGPAVGGGSELASLGDIVVATPRTKFAQPEVTIGVFPPFAATVLPHLIGPKRALEMVLTGEAISAERALELGLVNHVVPEAKLEETVNALIKKITAQSGPVLSMAKRAVIDGMGMSLRDALHHALKIFLNELYGLEDSQEGVRAVVEQRKPQWKNR
jgi:cyclohexa-1,5-dienecarbonyl-CoA hydratase|nr:enoyl-CoA hydratase/isomerase family protein [Candidatus Acidoferrales bacterium]